MVKKWLVAALLTGLTISISSFIFTTYQAKAQSPLNVVNNYKIYYGQPDDEIIEQLGYYDLAIVEPHEFTQEQVQKMNEVNTLSFGYISIMELQKWDKHFSEKVEEQDYYHINNEKIYYPKWDTYIMDISNPHYQKLLLEEIQQEIIAKGFDGIFLDTVGDIDDDFANKPKDLKKLRDGYIQFLKKIKKQNGELFLLQNWGFDTYKIGSNPYINGILWEDFEKHRIQKSKWAMNWVKYFKEAEKKGNVAVFTVSPNDTGKNYSEQHGFVSYVNKDSIYNEWEK